jgi:type II secretory ATPase GspE/PulE/Tfp pilus assembly ATPase PilB-like protein
MALKAPNGLILNTGPTGSGKTTTLYAFLKEIYSSEVKIITIEDPIEYKIPGIEQTQTHPETGYTFASGLRAIMRQDPDVILVGEIRDRETADIAMEASLTGHLVLSTLHANDAAATIPRLSDLGVKAETMGPALTLVIAQRLVRKLCPSCKEQIALTKEEQEHTEAFLLHLPPAIDKAPYQTKYRYAPKGCSLCNGTGYKGRLGIFELMTAGAALEDLIMKHATDTEIRAFAKAQGMITLQEDGILKVLAGETDWDEVEKVTGPIVWGK